MVAEELPDGRRQIQFGHASSLERKPQTDFETATLYAVFSDRGLNGCASFQRHVRDQIVQFPETERERPSIITVGKRSISTTSEELKEIASLAAGLGRSALF